MEKETKCPICDGKYCSCKNRKFVADIVFHFNGQTKAEVDKRLSEFRQKVQNLDGASMASFPGSSHENRYDKAEMEKIVDKFVTLMVTYNYDDEQIDEELANLKGRIDEAVKQYYAEMAADVAYDRMRDEQAGL